MTEMPGAKPVPLGQLVRAQDRLSFLYLEHCVIHRAANAITSTNQKGTIHLPAATLGALLLGPGTSVSQQAMVLLAESGTTTVWVGEHGVRYYAHGRSLARSSRLLERQAELVSNQRSRLRVARAMYGMRFPDEDVTRSTMQQLRGREGARVRRIYRQEAERTGIQWKRREYQPGEYDEGTRVNQALTAANASLYGVVHSLVVALGCSPGLGFVHTGHVLSFVFDVADLYKAELTIPLAFDLATRDGVVDIGAEARRAVRDHMRTTAFLQTCVRDIKLLLEGAGGEGRDWDIDADAVGLWDEHGVVVPAGVSYGSVTVDELSTPSSEDLEW